MLVAKHQLSDEFNHILFENYVNYAGSKTFGYVIHTSRRFENYVNYAGSKTSLIHPLSFLLFENYVNYAGSKTIWIPVI